MHGKILLRSPYEWRCYQEEELLPLPYSQFNPAHPWGSWAGSSSLWRRLHFLLSLLSPRQLSGEQHLDLGSCGAASALCKVICRGCWARLLHLLGVFCSWFPCLAKSHGDSSQLCLSATADLL